MLPNVPEGVDVLGWIPDADAEMSRWSLAIVPIHSGAGTRIKIAEAFSRKCPVVSTTYGAYGYDVKDREHVRLADTAADFTAACLELVRSPDLASTTADRAWSLFLERWTWEAIAPRVWDTMAAGLRGKPPIL
jgi:glycosyltransferase involved in cell wall biosynthesis